MGKTKMSVCKRQRLAKVGVEELEKRRWKAGKEKETGRRARGASVPTEIDTRSVV